MVQTWCKAGTDHWNPQCMSVVRSLWRQLSIVVRGSHSHFFVSSKWSRYWWGCHSIWGAAPWVLALWLEFCSVPPTLLNTRQAMEASCLVWSLSILPLMVTLSLLMIPSNKCTFSIKVSKSYMFSMLNLHIKTFSESNHNHVLNWPCHSRQLPCLLQVSPLSTVAILIPLHDNGCCFEHGLRGVLSYPSVLYFPDNTPLWPSHTVDNARTHSHNHSIQWCLASSIIDGHLDNISFEAILLKDFVMTFTDSFLVCVHKCLSGCLILQYGLAGLYVVQVSIASISDAK